MKNNPFKYFVFLMLSLLMVATTGCTEDDISMPAGQLPDETPMNSVGGQLCSGKTFSNKITVSMYEGDGAVTEEICYALTKPAITAVTVKAIPSPELVAQSIRRKSYADSSGFFLSSSHSKRTAISQSYVSNRKFLHISFVITVILSHKLRRRNYQHNSFS